MTLDDLKFMHDFAIDCMDSANFHERNGNGELALISFVLAQQHLKTYFAAVDAAARDK